MVWSGRKATSGCTRSYPTDKRAYLYRACLCSGN